jgi:hypothetical protein
MRGCTRWTAALVARRRITVDPTELRHLLDVEAALHQEVFHATGTQVIDEMLINEPQ